MATTVREHYKTHGQREWRRLVKRPFPRLEFDTTLQVLERRLPPSGLVLDAGGGPLRDRACQMAEISRLARRQPDGWLSWLAMHAALCTHPAVFATSQHMLVIARKPTAE